MGTHGRYALNKMTPCPACGTLSTDAERRGGEYKRGPAPALCITCQRANPGARWCKRCGCFEVEVNCPVQLRERDDRRRDAGEYRSTKRLTCPACGRSGTSFELYEGHKQGRTCRPCKLAHPDKMWCFEHKRFDPSSDFAGPSLRRCTRQYNECKSCERVLTRQQYMGTTTKPKGALPPVCVECARLHPAERWCAAHGQFEDEREFSRWSRGSCREADRQHQHGADVEALARVHGKEPGACMCCGGEKGRLVTDHDHECCPGARSCGVCVRGIVCYDCNNIEGKIRQIYGPPFPKLIQEYLDRAATYQAALRERDFALFSVAT